MAQAEKPCKCTNLGLLIFFGGAEVAPKPPGSTGCLPVWTNSRYKHALDAKKPQKETTWLKCSRKQHIFNSKVSTTHLVGIQDPDSQMSEI